MFFLVDGIQLSDLKDNMDGNIWMWKEPCIYFVNGVGVRSRLNSK